MTTYTFTPDELEGIRLIHDHNPGRDCDREYGPRGAYRVWHKLPWNAPIVTDEVEDFICSFYGQYNDAFGLTY